MRFKKWAREHWRIWYISYVFIYLPWFFMLEKLITFDHPQLHIMHSRIDDIIPFCEYFIVPYCLWFLYIAVSCVFMYFKATDWEYRRLAWMLIIGMSTCMLICMIYPNAVTMRPSSLEHDNFFAKIITVLWAADTSTNVFPSIHVYNSLVVHTALCKCEALKGHKVIHSLSLILCIAICLSTVFLKQHSVIDAAGAGILMMVMYYFMYIPAEERHFSFKKA